MIAAVEEDPRGDETRHATADDEDMGGYLGRLDLGGRVEGEVFAYDEAVVGLGEHDELARSAMA
jgi:hypothetical protein